MSWMNALSHLSIEQYFALNVVLILLPTIAIFTFVGSLDAKLARPRTGSLLVSLMLLWTVPIAFSIAVDGLWHELVFGELLIEPAILMLSLMFIGWYFLSEPFDEPFDQDQLRTHAGQMVFGLVICSLWFYLTWNLFQDNLNETALAHRVSLYHSIGDLLLTGLSAVFLVYGLLQFRKIPFAATKIYTFAILALTFTAVSLFNLSGPRFLGEHTLSYRMGWLLAMVSLPVLISRQRWSEQEVRHPLEWFPDEMETLTAEWAALQAMTKSMAIASISGIHLALLQAATQLSASRIGLFLRLPHSYEDASAHILEVVESMAPTQRRPEFPLAIRLSGSTHTMVSLRDHQSIVLDAEQDAAELESIRRQLDLNQAGKVWLLPFRRSQLVLLLVTKQQDAYPAGVGEIMHHFSRIADDILAQTEVEKQLPIDETNLPPRDLALRHAREHILRLTTELIHWKNRVESQPATSAQPKTSVGGNAPLIWQAKLEEKQRENARLKKERELLHERIREWEELFAVSGREGSAMTLWQHINDEKERLMQANAEIEFLREEMDHMRHQIFERAAQFSEPDRMGRQIVDPIPRKELPSHSFDLLSILEESLTKAANPLKTRAIRVQLAIQPRLPRVSGERGSIREALITLIEQIVQVAPRESALHIVAESQAGSLQLKIHIRSEAFPDSVAWREAQEQFRASGGQIHRRAAEESEREPAGETLEITLPAEPMGATVSAAS